MSLEGRPLALAVPPDAKLVGRWGSAPGHYRLRIGRAQANQLGVTAVERSLMIQPSGTIMDALDIMLLPVRVAPEASPPAEPIAAQSARNSAAPSLSTSLSR